MLESIIASYWLLHRSHSQKARETTNFAPLSDRLHVQSKRALHLLLKGQSKKLEPLFIPASEASVRTVILKQASS